MIEESHPPSRANNAAYIIAIDPMTLPPQAACE
jgi:hypothetical protein